MTPDLAQFTFITKNVDEVTAKQNPDKSLKIYGTSNKLKKSNISDFESEPYWK